MTESLIMYKKSGDECCGWESIYEQLSELIREMDSGIAEQINNDKKLSISPEFIIAVKKGAKAGIESG